ncbi:hypothetical protein FRX31_014228 [Thalictrum thalictroides]|uniref:Uncharacterized protein n=1 Tax=Thalictrum thalictroides TaxID=46969 RepID=A0A7J6WID2_THATH|nr:hypothetical protein FRX31_014228 [Thalictrum thalictroides]
MWKIRRDIQLHSQEPNSNFNAERLYIPKDDNCRHWFSVDTRAVNEILGTCDSVGCTVDGKNPIDLQQEIVEGEVWFSQESDEGLK